MKTTPKTEITRRCVICGAKIRNKNKHVHTCSDICTRARKTNRSRDEQIAHEVVTYEPDASNPYEYCWVCGLFHNHCACRDPFNHIN